MFSLQNELNLNGLKPGLKSFQIRKTFGKSIHKTRVTELDKLLTGNKSSKKSTSKLIWLGGKVNLQN